MTQAEPMTYASRLAGYGGDLTRLTPAQRRRLQRKHNHATLGCEHRGRVSARPEAPEPAESISGPRRVPVQTGSIQVKWADSVLAKVQQAQRWRRTRKSTP
jgi:hypothetical protein